MCRGIRARESERERGEKARKRNETEGLRQGRKEGKKKERRGWMEREKRRGIIQLLEETDRLKTFRGGICRGDPEILSPIKGISGGFRGVVLTINRKKLSLSF